MADTARVIRSTCRKSQSRTSIVTIAQEAVLTTPELATKHLSEIKHAFLIICSLLEGTDVFLNHLPG